MCIALNCECILIFGTIFLFFLFCLILNTSSCCENDRYSLNILFFCLMCLFFCFPGESETFSTYVLLHLRWLFASRLASYHKQQLPTMYDAMIVVAMMAFVPVVYLLALVHVERFD